MRILEINQCHYRRGGADIVYLNTGKLLESKGHQVAYFSTANSKNENTCYSKYFLENKDLRNIPFSEKFGSIRTYLYNKEAKEKLTQLIKDFKPDVAHVHLFYAYLSVSVLETLKQYNIPIIHTVHDYRLLCPVNTLMDKNKKICEKCAKGSSLNCVAKKCSEGSLSQSTMLALEAMYWSNFKSPLSYIDHFHFVSNFCLQKHLEYLPELKSKSSIHCNFSEIKENKSVERSKGYFLYYGRLSFQKGILTLVKAWKEVPANINLKIVGTGDQINPIKEFIIQHSLNNVAILGYKSGEELNQLVQNARFVIVPSEWYENNPMTIIEAYHLGVPVIGANIGGIPEIIQLGKTGFIFESKNSSSLNENIKKANSINSATYQSMRKNCINYAGQYFSQESNYKYLLNLFEKLMDGTSIK